MLHRCVAAAGAGIIWLSR